MIKISVVIPVYNAENTIVGCLDSLAYQKMVDAEFIIINDGSTDNSDMLVTKYTEKDKRFKKINQENKGVSSARNVGLSNCIGKYIAFLDADDCFLRDDALDILFHCAEEEMADIVAFGNVTSIIGSEYSKHYPISGKKLIDKKTGGLETLSLTLFNPEYRPSVWNKLYRKTIIQNNQFQSYNEVISEDTLFNIDAFMNSNRIMLLDMELYGYHIVDNSLSHKKTYYDVEVRICNSIRYIENRIKHLNDEIYGLISSYYAIELLGTQAALLRLYNRTNSYDAQRMINNTLSVIKECSNIDTWSKSVSFNSLIKDRSKGQYYNFIRRLIIHNRLKIASLVILAKTDISGILRKKSG